MIIRVRRFSNVVFATTVALLFISACSRHPAPELNVMNMIWCDSTPMLPLGRPIMIPDVIPRANQAALTGTVAQAETGDALESAVVDLRQIDPAPTAPLPWRMTNSKGGFSFDSIAPGHYMVRVRRLGSFSRIDTVNLVAARVDTLSFRLRAYRCHGY